MRKMNNTIFISVYEEKIASKSVEKNDFFCYLKGLKEELCAKREESSFEKSL